MCKLSQPVESGADPARVICRLYWGKTTSNQSDFVKRNVAETVDEHCRGKNHDKACKFQNSKS